MLFLSMSGSVGRLKDTTTQRRSTVQFSAKTRALPSNISFTISEMDRTEDRAKRELVALIRFG